MYSHTRMATPKPIILLAAVTLFYCPDARADIYKCSDDDGNLTFQQTPCPKKKPVEESAEEMAALVADVAEQGAVESTQPTEGAARGEDAESLPGHSQQSDLVELCKKKYRDAIDAIDAEMSQDFSSEQGEAYRQRLQILTKQLRAC